jgi:hypothetical protein
MSFAPQRRYDGGTEKVMKGNSAHDVYQIANPNAHPTAHLQRTFFQ